jgi:hypothetical protein
VRFQPGSRLGRKDVLQIILDAPGGDVGFLPPPCLPGRLPFLNQARTFLPNRSPIQDLGSEDGARRKLLQVREIGEEKPPRLDLGPASRTDGEVLLDPGFLLGSKLSVQKLLDPL